MISQGGVVPHIAPVSPEFLAILPPLIIVCSVGAPSFENIKGQKGRGHQSRALDCCISSFLSIAPHSWRPRLVVHNVLYMNINPS